MTSGRGAQAQIDKDVAPPPPSGAMWQRDAGGDARDTRAAVIVTNAAAADGTEAGGEPVAECGEPDETKSGHERYDRSSHADRHSQRHEHDESGVIHGRTSQRTRCARDNKVRAARGRSA